MYEQTQMANGERRQDEARERQARILAATRDYLRRAQRPDRAGAGGPLFDNQQTGCEGLDQ